MISYRQIALTLQILSLFLAIIQYAFLNLVRLTVLTVKSALVSPNARSVAESELLDEFAHMQAGLGPSKSGTLSESSGSEDASSCSCYFVEIFVW